MNIAVNKKVTNKNEIALLAGKNPHMQSTIVTIILRFSLLVHPFLQK